MGELTAPWRGWGAQAMRDSMTIIDPLEPLDHVFDMGVQYVPSMEESIAELGLMVPDFAERNYNFGMVNAAALPASHAHRLSSCAITWPKLSGCR